MGATENGKNVKDARTAHSHVANCPMRLKFQKTSDNPLYARTDAQKMQIRNAVLEHTVALNKGNYIPANMPFPNMSNYYTPDP
jgi:hypothetical protein